ncbi:hypothetical protein VB834_14150 [Limnoraphis robusta Tam1]|uniref:Uncharacterized protein n=1 Tax=Limnoraphis robusta CCNP1315 TaxID=3110306 RepID=A0ABU5TXN4_9CYAN|nr:hypothetical protein [Limnoraphis robusta]MEA5497288.1 hypothetical protein [Limnoraphis robusta BA-68 BA1]MEA5519706.1 hypothetical protein [Limnoraphis robusta CCNP1315]MEA5540173.1 hypothetical protein [Limnoraphis robusta Tam1]MEA5544800.1 hypothetical protein [Limnoraphis robusta CCNP1324]
MRIESIEQKYITNPNDNQTNSEAILATQVIFDGVSSPCILSRLMIEALGRPGKDNDMELVNSGERCIVIWTQPQLSLEVVQNIIHNAIAP